VPAIVSQPDSLTLQKAPNKLLEAPAVTSPPTRECETPQKLTSLIQVVVLVFEFVSTASTTLPKSAPHLEVTPGPPWELYRKDRCTSSRLSTPAIFMRTPSTISKHPHDFYALYQHQISRSCGSAPRLPSTSGLASRERSITFAFQLCSPQSETICLCSPILNLKR
jgi:hypothetical protein